MKSGELLRVRFAFGLLGLVPVFLAGWFGYVQVAQAGRLERPNRAPLPLSAAVADSYAKRSEQLPAPRGSILDRNGATLAADCEAYEVRARVRVPRTKRKDLTLFRPWLARLADDLAMALVADPELPERSELYARHSARLRRIMEERWGVDSLPASGSWPAGRREVIDFLVAGGVDRLRVLDELAVHDQSKAYPTLHLQRLHSFKRVYPERELTYGIVGHTESREAAAGSGASYETFGVCGLESFAALTPHSGAVRRFLADGRHRPYFLAPVQRPPEPVRLHSTLDLELQRACVRELAQQCEAGMRGAPDDRPVWGGMALLEVATGDVLAAASWRDGAHPKGAAFAPYQSRFEPGSIVKPLVVAYALEVGAVSWADEFDCAPNGEMYRRVIRSLGRRRAVKDDHDCSVLTPHGILLNSSNIGAAMVGLRLTREQWQDYMSTFGWGRSLGLRLPHESLGGHPKRSFSPEIPLRGFRANSAISFSFGYEMTTTALQVARAYLRLLRGVDAELRLVRGLEIDGEWHRAPQAARAGRSFRPEVRERVFAALRDVISDSEGATGRSVVQRFRKEGVELHGLVGGKTGTAFSPVRDGGKTVTMRNASFVGVLPAEDPRWLAVCVLQKKGGRARFYGSSYAAPPAVRLLLRCRELRGGGTLRQEPQVGPGGQTRTGLQSPDLSGWGESVGADEPRETR
ncbi:MAG: penicillin-binding transpeptidase domain-containing protein [Planctomycetota bacterium]